jgi:trehalose 6-phosphate synthase/phosphatase
MGIDISYIIEKYQKANNKLILLDYDGTLVNFTNSPEDAIPSMQLLDLLEKLNRLPHCKLVIITGRYYQDIERLIGHLPIKIIAEHGALIKENKVWREVLIEQRTWKKEVNMLLKEFTAKSQGSFIEEKRFSIAWHYRNVDNEKGQAYSRQLISLLKSLIQTYHLKILDGNKVVEVMNKGIGKGEAVKKLLRQNRYDFVLSIGDDASDEEIFKLLMNNDNAVSVKVGPGRSVAKNRLDNVDDVIILLEQLSLLK